MSAPKHTTGPWRFNEFSSRNCWLEGANGETVYHVDDGSHVPSEADARLIVAAPDLLLAAKEAAVVIADMAKVTGADLMKGTCLPRLLAAIAKAEVREP